MTPKIMIEQHPVEFAGFPSGVVHLYLVYRGEDGAEYVLRSGPRNDLPVDTEMEIEANVPIAQSEDARGNDTPAERSSTELAFPDATADQAWAIMVKYARLLDDVDYGYHAFQENSNAFIGALLHAAGGTPARMLPSGVSASEALGFSSWGRIVDDVPPPANGIIYGTSGADSLAGMQIIDVIRAQGGNDVVNAGAGSDRGYGGAGRDAIHGGDGNDRLWGEGDGDTLWGDAGRDRLIGGSGNDRLVGGSGADTFEFFAGDGRDRIDYFVPGTDRLVIHTTLAEDVGNLDLSQSGADVRIDVGADTMFLRDLDLDALRSGDLLLA